MSKDKIIAVMGAHDINSYIRVSGKTGAVIDINGNECLVSEYQLYDWLHMARLLGYKVTITGGEQ